MSARVLIADDHPLFRSALRLTVKKVWNDAEVIEANAVDEARGALSEPADLLLLDLHMADSHGLSALIDFREDYPAMPVVVVSASEEPRVTRAARQLGASAFIPKSASFDDMSAALQAVKLGDTWFPGSPADAGGKCRRRGTGADRQPDTRPAPHPVAAQ